MILFLGSFMTSNAGMQNVLTSLGFKNFLIPMWNATYLTKNILMTGFTATEMLVTCGINILFGVRFSFEANPFFMLFLFSGSSISHSEICLMLLLSGSSTCSSRSSDHL